MIGWIISGSDKMCEFDIWRVDNVFDKVAKVLILFSSQLVKESQS